MFLVMGITGRVGASVAKHLRAQGKQVRAMVRDQPKAADWAKLGVELVDGELSDPTAIARALDGVKGAFIMLPPVYTPSRDFSESKVLITAYVQALSLALPPRLVVLSSNGAEQTSGLGAITPLSLLEKALAEVACPSAFIRAGSFYENFLHGLQTAKCGTLSVFYARPTEKSPMTAIEDIGAEAAKLLCGPDWEGERVIELGSMVSPAEVAVQLGEVLRRDVTARSVPRDAWTSTIEKMGFPSGQTWAFEEIYDGVNSQWIGFGVKGAERVEGGISARDVFASAQESAGV
jgi:uncharacterized protein YbjT (DUF2867 family)